MKRSSLARVAGFVATSAVLVGVFQNCSPFQAATPQTFGGGQFPSADPGTAIIDSGNDLPPSQYNGTDGYDVVVIAGQSNAVGFGCGSQPAVSTANDHRIFQLDTSHRILPASDPLHHRPTQGNAVGFGLTFARLYAQTLPANRKVLIVPAARGSTSILQWDDLDEGINFQEMAAIPTDSTELWNALIARTRAAMQVPGTNRLVALLWHQGENDYSFMKMPTRGFHRWMPDTEAYQARLRSLVNGFRAYFPSQRPVPFIAGELGSFWSAINGADASGALLGRFNQDLARIRMLPLTDVVSASGLQSNLQAGCSTDDAHFSAASQVELGRRYFNALMAMTSALTPVMAPYSIGGIAPPSFGFQVDSSRIARVNVAVPAAPNRRFRGIEAPPWITLGGSFGYTITTAESSYCWADASLAKTTSLSVNCNDVNTSTVSSEVARGMSDDDRRPWARNYDGILSMHKVQDPSRGDILLSIHHGENLNENRTWPSGPTVRMQNSLTDVPSMSLANCYSDFTGGPNSSSPMSCYFAFLTAGWKPNTLAEGWGSYGTFNNVGPIAWPVSGYVKADGTQASRGLRHPSSFVEDGYIYVYYLDASLAPQRGIRVIRARLEEALNPFAWQRLSGGRFVTGTLPSGFSVTHERINPNFYKMQGPANDFVFPPTARSDRFSVARLRGLKAYVGVENYLDDSGRARVGLRTSKDLIHWSERIDYDVPGYTGQAWPNGGPHYPVFMNWEGTSNTVVDADRFYVNGAIQGQSALVRVPFRLFPNEPAPAPVATPTHIIQIGSIPAGVPISCDYFNPDAIKQLPESTIRWLATIQPSGLTLHENYLAARQAGYNGAFGAGEHAAYQAQNPAYQAHFQGIVASMANNPNPPYATFREHHVGQRAAGYQGLFLCGGGACFFSGGCDELGRRK